MSFIVEPMWCGQAKLQRLLLRWAVKLLKPGGTLVFSTCTINPAENEANVTPQHPMTTLKRLSPPVRVAIDS